MNLKHSCPSGWTELDSNVCEAPPTYAGKCGPVIETAGFSDKDKLEFSVQCDARWPCLGQSEHAYTTMCPAGWTLAFGQVCLAPPGYSKCSRQVHVGGMTDNEKKRFEAACDVSWPDVPDDCERDLSSCPYGWHEVAASDGVKECIAYPLQPSLCNRVQRLNDLSPSGKREWAQNCGERWPCTASARQTCERNFESPCPAGWALIHGGEACFAPERFRANNKSCPVVIHRVKDINANEKLELSKVCSPMSWPCLAELPYQGISPRATPHAPMDTSSFKVSGPINDQGKIVPL